jgi:tetratricopeptide (TPR) repeat protein
MPFPPSSEHAKRLADLDARLSARLLPFDSVDDAERAALKADIIALYRDVDRDLAALVAVKEEVKELVAKWKRLPSGDPASPDDASARDAEMSLPVLSGRVDHLGASTFVAKGWSAISVGDHPAAEQALARALELAPEDLEAATLLGWAMMGQGRHDDALVVLQGVLAREPSYALARVNIGYVCLQKGVYGEAIEHLVRAARTDGDRKATLYANLYLGLVYQRREMYDDAASFFHTALSLGPNLIEARYELGRTHYLAGDRAAALEAWRGGAQASKLNAWSKRCDEAVKAVEQGDAPPAVSSSASAGPSGGSRSA